MSEDSNELKEQKNYFLLSHDELLMIRNDLHMGDIKKTLNKVNDAIKKIEENLPSKKIVE